MEKKKVNNYNKRDPPAYNCFVKKKEANFINYFFGLCEQRQHEEVIHHLIRSTVVWECRHSGPQWKKPLYPLKPTWLCWMALRETAMVNSS